MSVDFSYLRNYSCFDDLDDAQLSKVSDLCEAECFYPNHILFEDGKPGTHLYLLAKGEVEILFAIGEEGLAAVDRVGVGRVIGCSALVSPYMYRSTVRSLGETEALILNAVQLRELMKEDCVMGMSIQQHIIQLMLDQIVDRELGS
jgi:CRP-like cAMP-binding protein